jgi:phospholipase/lecithinase/hemolysin
MKLIAEQVVNDLQQQYSPWRLMFFFRMISFGDSFSDTGMGFHTVERVIGTGLPPSPPYFSGRFTNGPNVVDYINELLELRLPSSFFPQPTTVEFDAIVNSQ